MEQEKSTQLITLSKTEAEEYQAYKRQKHIMEVTSSISRAVLTPETDSVKRICAYAVKMGCAAVKVTPTQLSTAKAALSETKVRIDCAVGGLGETFSKVKAYEAKLAGRFGAQEITLALSESDVKNSRFSELKKEIKRVCRSAKQCAIKVCLRSEWGHETMLRIARLAAEVGAKYISVPYFEGCERLKFDLHAPLGVEVTCVNSTAVFRKMVAAGMQLIQTNRLQEIYDELMKDAENSPLSVVEPVLAPTASEKDESQDETANEAKDEKDAKEKKRKEKLYCQLIRQKQIIS